MKRRAPSRQPSTPIWAWPNLLGLDAPVVAVCWQSLFADLLEIQLPWMIHLVLALSAWCVYLADRLIDVSRSRLQPFDTNRHRFTARHFKKLIVLLAMVSALNLILIIRHLPANLIIAGCVTAGLIAIYYLIRLTRLRKYVSLIPRELLCGMLFAVGCVIGPHAYASELETPFAFGLVVVLFGLLCSASCILISIWEKESDLASNDPSVVTSQKKLIPHVANCLLALAVITVALSFLGFWKVLLSIALAAILLRLTLRFQNHLSTLTCRVLADALLLTPVIFLPF